MSLLVRNVREAAKVTSKRNF